MTLFYDPKVKKHEAPLVSKSSDQPHYLILTLEELVLADGYDNDSKGKYWRVFELPDEVAWKEKIAELTHARKDVFMPMVSYLPVVDTIVQVYIKPPPPRTPSSR